MMFSLLNDGVNTYTYDPANRLSVVSNQSSVTSYTYNGLGDRLQTAVGSQTTSYLMDLNAGLSQVLDDGTNTYLYGNGRIAQVDTASTQYFLGDALGSVRQLTNASGAITLARSYDPYGNVVTSAGVAQTSYGFTAEQTDSNGLIYLRARYYAPGAGRFMTRDTWSGTESQPMSYNKWAYTYGNPVNLTDPSGLDAGEFSGCSVFPGLNAGYVESQVHNLSRSDFLDTYTAAGLAVQCWATDFDWRPGNDSWGPAQVSYTQAETPMGGVLSDDLRCYVYRRALGKSFIYSDLDCVCGKALPLFKLEPALDPLNWDDAATLMQRRITHATNQCNNCGDTDIYIFAGMAQNGPGFTGGGVYKLKPKTLQTKDVTMDWDTFYRYGAKKDTSDQLSRFRDAVNAFVARGWTVPYIDATAVIKYINYPHTH